MPASSGPVSLGSEAHLGSAPAGRFSGVAARLGRISLAIYLLALLVRLLLLFGFHRYEIGRPETVKIAMALAASGSFADPYAVPTGPTAHSPPVYPLLISPLYAIFGDTRRADLARMIFSALVACSEYALLPYVARALGLGIRPGVLAGFAGALIPLHHWPECMGDFETAWAAVFLELSVLFFARFLKKPPVSPASAARAGGWWAFGLLLAPNVLPVLLGFAAVVAWRRGLGRPGALRWCAVFTGAMLAGIAPWLARNYVQLGGVAFVRDNFGLELYVSNNDQALADAGPNMGTSFFQTEHPHPNRAAAEQLKREGELNFERERLRRTAAWIRGNPGKFLRLTLARFRNFWFPDLRFRINQLALWAITCAGFTGLGLLLFENRLAAATLASVLATFPAVYYVLQNNLRYQHPIYWVLLLLGAYAALRIAARVLASSCANPAARSGSRDLMVR